MKASLNKFVWTVILLFCFFIFSSCIKETSHPLQMATNTWIGYEPLFLARNMGYFSSKNIVLHEMPNSSDVIKAFRNQTIDLAALTIDEALLLIQDGVAVKILFVIDVSNGADVILSKPEIKDLKGLKNKKIGVETMAVGAFMLSRGLDAAGLTPNDVTVVPVTFEDHEQAYLSNKVDAVVTFEPVKTRLLNKGARQIFDSSMIPNEIYDVLVVNPSFLKSHSKEIKELEEAWYKALTFLKENQGEACRRMGLRVGLTQEEFKKSLSGIKIPDKEENKRLLENENQMAIEKLINVLVKSKLLKRSVNSKELFLK